MSQGSSSKARAEKITETMKDKAKDRLGLDVKSSTELFGVWE